MGLTNALLPFFLLFSFLSLTRFSFRHFYTKTLSTTNKMLSYRRETALQDELILAKSGRLELGDNILRTS